MKVRLDGAEYDLDAPGCARNGCARDPEPFYRYRQIEVDGHPTNLPLCSEHLKEFLRGHGPNR
jgi:hypothetical protein